MAPDEQSWLIEFRAAVAAQHADAVKDVLICGSKAPCYELGPGAGQGAE